MAPAGLAAAPETVVAPVPVVTTEAKVAAEAEVTADTEARAEAQVAVETGVGTVCVTGAAPRPGVRGTERGRRDHSRGKDDLPGDPHDRCSEPRMSPPVAACRAILGPMWASSGNMTGSFRILVRTHPHAILK